MMGWWGHYVGGKAPKGKERIELVLIEEGYKAKRAEDENQIWEVVDSAIRGTTVYLAIRITDKATGQSRTTAQVCLTSYEKDGYFMVKTMGETMGPGEHDCPKHILDKLTPTDNEWANEWRKACENRRKRDRTIERLPMGTRLKFKTYREEGYLPIVEVCKYRGRRAYVDWLRRIRYTPNQIRYYGFETIEDAKR